MTVTKSDPKTGEEKTIEASRRKGLVTTLTASIDGVPRKLRILVLKKDGYALLPDYHVVILDEAHTVERVAEDHFGID